MKEKLTWQLNFIVAFIWALIGIIFLVPAIIIGVGWGIFQGLSFIICHFWIGDLSDKRATFMLKLNKGLFIPTDHKIYKYIK